MKFVFLLRFFTRPGEELRIGGDLEELGLGTPSGSVSMSYMDDRYWKFELDISKEYLIRAGRIRYWYVFHPVGEMPVADWESQRFLEIPEDAKIQVVQYSDTWNHAGEIENVFYTAPFRKVLLSPHECIPPLPRSTFTHSFRVKSPLVQSGQALCLIGSADSIGGWDKSRSVQMHVSGDWWEVSLNLASEQFPLTYKYGVMDLSTGVLTEYEEGTNRVLEQSQSDAYLHILHDGFTRFNAMAFRAAGIAIPVFSLRSDRGFGVGQFTDIPLLVDWARQVGIRMIQLLPVNDTTSKGTWEDSYPYSAISASALHPLYLDLEQVAGSTHRDLLATMEEHRPYLASLPELDYERVMRIKLDILHVLSLRCAVETFATEDFKKFFEQNRHWLMPYAAFCHLRDRFGTPDTSRWKSYSRYSEASIRKLCDPQKPTFREIAQHYFTQYYLHLQLQAAHEYANSQGVILKGDIPIGVSRNGVETWMEPECFHLDQQAGAPPDDFAVKGQNWEFPTYNWSHMKGDGFAWWKKRFEQMSRYYDAFRIDHILGFFRIWSIPYDAMEGILGRFVPAIPIHLDEFQARNIPFDYERLCRPWIDDTVLWQLFGSYQEELKPYLRRLSNGRYELLEEFNTQRKIHEYLTTQCQIVEKDRLRQALFDLVSNVVLFEEPGSFAKKFHFRFKMEETSSWQHLDSVVRQSLKELYIEYFFSRQDAIWRQEAMEKLPALKRCTEMLICGEDLGLVPGCVPDVMRRLGILSMEVQRMPKDPNKEFFHPADAPYLSVVTPSSHDMSTVREWWTEAPSRTQRFFTHELGQYSQAPESCEPWISERILLQHLQSPAQWAVFQIQDLLAIDGQLRRSDPSEERINVPANSRHYWRYRMHHSLEQLMSEESFNHRVRAMVSSTGRMA